MIENIHKGKQNSEDTLHFEVMIANFLDYVRNIYMNMECLFCQI